MNKERKCLVGHDKDKSIGWFFGVLIVIIFTIVVVALSIVFAVFCGVFVGGFHSIKNYLTSLKHTIIDSNRKSQTAIEPDASRGELSCG